MPCKAEDLATVKLFELLDKEELGELAAVIDSQTLAAGETLFNAGDFGETLYIVNYGEVELSIKDTAGQKIVLKVAAEDDLFGEISMLDKRPRSATAVSLMDTELFVLDRDDLHTFLHKHPDAALDLLTTMGQRIRSTDELLRRRVARNINLEMDIRSTAIEKAADVILAAQAMLFAGLTDDLLVATYNERHLSRYLNARHWRAINP